MYLCTQEHAHNIYIHLFIYMYIYVGHVVTRVSTTHMYQHIQKHAHNIYIFIYVYIYIQTHAHNIDTYIYIYIYIHVGYVVTTVQGVHTDRGGAPSVVTLLHIHYCIHSVCMHYIHTGAYLYIYTHGSVLLCICSIYSSAQCPPKNGKIAYEMPRTLLLLDFWWSIQQKHARLT